MAFWLRVIQINDVYALDNFPSFYTLVQEKSNEDADYCLVVLAGDFLGPSLLSSLDKGAGMVDILNRVGITHVCFGNHECDVPMESLQRRICQQSKFVWLNSNMQELNMRVGVETPEFDIVTITNAHGETKRIALLGLLTDDPGLYRPGAFGNARIEPTVETTHRLLAKLKEDQIDFILPLTHQSIEEDRSFAQEFSGDEFPIIIGGHDHNVFDEVVNGARIVKTGYDAQNTNIIDFRWGTGNKDRPDVSVEMVPTTSFARNEELQARVEGHRQIILELEKAKLFCIHQWTDGEEFSTKRNRLGPSHGSTALVTMMRMGLQAQCCILNAGSIRGGKTYPPHTFFTWSDLKAEIPFTTSLITLWVPGAVLEATIRQSRRYSRQNPQIAHGCYLHTCNNIEYNDETESIDKILSVSMNPHQLYLTGMDVQFLQGIDNHEPLLEWAAEKKIKYDPEAGKPAKLVLVELFSALLWLHLGSFEDMDSDKDGVLRRDEVKASVSRHFRDPTIADLVVDNVFAIADVDGNGTISPLEMIMVHLMATDLISPQVRGDDDEQLESAMKDTVAHVLNEDEESERVANMVERIRKKMCVGENGKLRKKKTRENPWKASERVASNLERNTFSKSRASICKGLFEVSLMVPSVGAVLDTFYNWQRFMMRASVLLARLVIEDRRPEQRTPLSWFNSDI